MILKLRMVIIGLRQRNLLGYLGALVSRAMEVVGKFGLYMLAAQMLGAHD